MLGTILRTDGRTRGVVVLGPLKCKDEQALLSQLGSEGDSTWP